MFGLGLLNNISTLITLTNLGNKQLEIFLRWQDKVRWAYSFIKLVISSVRRENPNGHFYEDKNNDDIPVRCIQKSSSIDSNDSTEAPTLTIETNVNGAVRAGKHVTFTFIFKEPVFGFTDEDVKIENGTVKAGLTRDKSKAHAWKLVVRPTQGRNSGVLKVEVRADSVFGKKANGNKAAIGSVSLNTIKPDDIEQWAVSASASSEYKKNPSDDRYLASQATGEPDTGLKVGDPHKEVGNAWAEAKKDRSRLNDIVLTYKTPVYITSVVIRETWNFGEDTREVWGQDMDTKEEVLLYNGGGLGGTKMGHKHKTVSDAQGTPGEGNNCPALECDILSAGYGYLRKVFNP
jgi:hypothetical protein